MMNRDTKTLSLETCFPRKPSFRRTLGVVLVIMFAFGIFAHAQIPAGPGAFPGNQNFIGPVKPQTIEERPVGVECQKGFLGPFTLCHAVQFIESSVDWIGGGLLTIVGAFFEKMVSININTSTMEGRALIGWTVIRDIANIFYIFILLWIALATIFDFDRFSAKNLLPRLIISALLINFSLVIGMAVINTANSLALVYYKNLNLSQTIRELSVPTELLSYLQTSPFSKNLTKTGPSESEIKAGIKKLYESTVYNPPGEKSFSAEHCKDLEGKYKTNTEREHCAALMQLADTQIAFILPDASSDAKNDFLIQAKTKALPLKLIVYPLAIFTIGAGGVFMLTRYISLLFVLILGPLAFAAMILPGTEEHWTRWWKKLIDLSIFFPAFIILVFISSKILAANRLGGTSEYFVYGQSIPSFMDLMIQVLIGGGFMIGSLMAAQQLGIAGANKIMSTGQKWAKGAGYYAKRGALAPARFASAKAMEVGGKAMARQLSKLQSTRFGQFRGVGKVLGQAQAGLKGVGPGEFGVSETEFGRKYGTIMKGSDESVVKYAAGLAQRNPNDAAAILNRLSVEKRRKGIGKLSGAEATTLGQHLSKIGADNLVRSASGNPATLVDLMQPQMAEEIAKHQATLKNPNLTEGERLNAETNLVDAEKKREDAIKHEFETMKVNRLLGSISPEFIEKHLNEDITKTLDFDDIRVMASTGAGAKAISSKLNTEINKLLEESVKEAIAVRGPNAPALTEDEIKEFHETAEKRVHAKFFSSDVVSKLKTSPAGQTILRGGAIIKEKTPEEKVLEAFQQFGSQAGPPGPQTPPPAPPKP